MPYPGWRMDYRGRDVPGRHMCRPAGPHMCGPGQRRMRRCLPQYLNGIRAQRLEPGEATGKKSPLGLGMRKLKSTLVRGASLGRPGEAAQEIGAGSMEVVVGVQLIEAVDGREPCLRALRSRQRDGSVQLDDRGAGQAGELAVQGGDLRPVALVLGV